MKICTRVFTFVATEQRRLNLFVSSLRRRRRNICNILYKIVRNELTYRTVFLLCEDVSSFPHTSQVFQIWHQFNSPNTVVHDRTYIPSHWYNNHAVVPFRDNFQIIRCTWWVLCDWRRPPLHSVCRNDLIDIR